MKQFKDVNGVTLCYDDTMELDKKPLLLYHGLTGNKESMYLFRDQFKDRYRVITVDTRGHGESTHPERYTLADHGADVHALIDALGLEKVDILGYSMGSYVALAAAEQRSDDIDHLILLCTKAAGKTSSVERIAKEQGLDVRTLTPEQMQKIMLSCAFAPKTLAKLQSGEFQMPSLSPEEAGVALTAEEKEYESRSLANFDLTGELDRVGCKTLVVAGEFDGINPKELGEEVANGIAGSRYVVIPDAGHMVPMEQPARFFELAHSFLRE